MLLTEVVLAFADGRTPKEIAKRSGLPLARVELALDFLIKYSFVKADGSKMRVEKALASLPVC